MVLVIAGFIIGEHYHIRPGTTAMMGAAVLLLVTSIGSGEQAQGRKLHDALHEVEWVALFFFMGLFVVVSGVEHSGLLTLLGEKLMHAHRRQSCRNRRFNALALCRRFFGP